MSLTVACPGCHKSYNVPDGSVGTRATCKSCGHKFTVAVAADETQGGGAPRRHTPRPGEATHPQTLVHSGAIPSEQPKRLGRFEVRERLGGGGFGTVYRGYDPVLKRDVALKVPHASALASEESRGRLCQEPEAAAQLRHPNIVPIYDAGFDGDEFFIASAFIEGSTLDAAIHRGEIEPVRAAAIARKLADALDCAYEQGIVHRDVKPANVMLDRRGEPQLMDFGLAQWAQASERFTQDGTILGTPAYMSPEQAGGPAREVGPASDQYSLGATLYEMLAGEPPFSGPVLAIVYQVREKEPPTPGSLRPGVPPALEAICLRAMAKLPAARFASCRQLAEALDAWLKQAERSTPATPIALARQASGGHQPPGDSASLSLPLPIEAPRRIKWTHRHTWAATAAAFVIMCGVLLLIPTPKGTIRIEVNDPLAVVEVDSDVVRVEQLGEPLELTVGEHDLIVRRGDLTVETRKFTVKRGDNDALTVTLTPVAVTVTPPTDDDQAESTATTPVAEGPATTTPAATAPVFITDSDEEIENSIGMRLRRIEPGEFQMGAPATEQGYNDSQRQHRVRITKPFYIGVYEVTQAEFQRINGINLSQFRAGRNKVPAGTDTDRFPVDTCSYDDAQGFCSKLSALPEEVSAGRVYRLPTEAEWEFACRAGTTTPYNAGEKLSSYEHANFAGDFVQGDDPPGRNLGRTTAVGSYAPNAWGLYDMHGNVWEWCSDRHSDNYYDSSPVDDPQGPATGANRIFRGGAFDSLSVVCRSAHRGCNGPPARWNHNGFRVTMTPTEPVANITSNSVSEVAPASNDDESGFVSIFNGQNLQGWTVDSGKQSSWSVQDGQLVMSASRFDNARYGYLLSLKDYGDFILRFQFQATDGGDSGVALRAIANGAQPSLQLQVQVADDAAPALKDGPTGGLFHVTNPPNTMQQPDRKASLKPAGEWNDMEIYLQGNTLRVSVNGQQVYSTSLAAFADRPNAFAGLKRTSGRIGFQAHTALVKYRDIRIKELPEDAATGGGFVGGGYGGGGLVGSGGGKPAGGKALSLFNGRDLTGWQTDGGGLAAWRVATGELTAMPGAVPHGWLLTDADYANFILRLRFQLAAGANGGVALRAAPGEKHVEVQLLDDTASRFSALPLVERTGALYQLDLDRRATLKPLGEWNDLEIRLNGAALTVTINANQVLGTRLDRFANARTDLPGLMRSAGRIGLQEQSGVVRYRDITVENLPD